VKDVTGGEWYFLLLYSCLGVGSTADPITAGNAFLGGYIAGLSHSSGDPYEAALYATVSASFVVEQMGLPVLLTPTPTATAEQREQSPSSRSERWNGDSPWNRLEALRARLDLA
jgi:hypothetical protein